VLALTQALQSVLGPIGPLLHSGVSVAPQPKHFVAGFTFSPCPAPAPAPVPDPDPDPDIEFDPTLFAMTVTCGETGCLPSSGQLETDRDVCPEMMCRPSAARWMSVSNGCDFDLEVGGGGGEIDE